MEKFKNLMYKNKKLKDRFKKKKLTKHLLKKKKKRLSMKFAQVLWRLKKKKTLLNFYDSLKDHLIEILPSIEEEIEETKICWNKKVVLDSILRNRLLLNKKNVERLRKKCYKVTKKARQYQLWEKKRKYREFTKIIKRNLMSKKKIRLKHNINVEVNVKIYAFSFITKEFLHSPKFLRSKPIAFTNRINRFIKHFF